MNYKAVGKLGNTINLKIFHYNIVISFSMSHIDFRSPSETFRVNYLKFNFLMIFLFFFFFSFFFFAQINWLFLCTLVSRLACVLSRDKTKSRDQI